MESPNLEEENIIQHVRKLFRRKKLKTNTTDRKQLIPQLKV